jgi:S1-C subfamily serine protease
MSDVRSCRAAVLREVGRPMAIETVRIGPLAPGDVLLAVDGTPLDSPSALAEQLDGAGERAVRLHVLRGGSVRLVGITPRSAG